MNVPRRNALKLISGTGLSLAGLDALCPAAEPPVTNHAPKARQVIVLYMSGGFSHVDTFDPKQRLSPDHDVSIGTPLEAAPN